VSILLKGNRRSKIEETEETKETEETEDLLINQLIKAHSVYSSVSS
jgi:hypothetical protein